MQRYLDTAVRADLGRKMVFLTGSRQVGKTTLAKSLMAAYPRAQYLNWDVPSDRRILLDQTWSPAPASSSSTKSTRCATGKPT